MESEATIVIDDDDPRFVARTRRFVVERLKAHGLGDLAADAELVASELVTNALLHAGPPVEVVLQVSPLRARLEVRDRSPVRPLRLHAGAESMTGRGLRLVAGLTSAWGVSPLDGGKNMWAELEVGGSPPADLEQDQLIAPWLGDDSGPAVSAGEERHIVRLGDVPTDLLLTAKSHVDDLVREFTLAASGAASGMSAEVPPALAELIETVVSRFAEAREAIRRQALRAKVNDQDHVTLELHLPARAAQAGEDYLQALDQADAYCRAARMLTLESSPQHRLFRRWYIEELVGQLRHAAGGAPAVPSETFEQRLLREIDRMAESERRMARAARLHELAIALAAATTPEMVVAAALDAGASVLGAAGGAVLLAAERSTLAVPGSIGYDAQVVARLQEESPAAELPAATALRTGEAVWLESREERDARFPELIGLEPGTVSLVAVPLDIADHRLGAMRFSFTEARLFDEGERSFIAAIAAQTAQALERAQLAAAHSDAARRLQRSLLPPALPSASGIAISAAYHPVAASLEMGGDFYDMWPRGPRQLALAIGDVSGHGPEAAAITALVRHTLRAVTLTSTDTVAILGRLDDALREALPGTDRFATVTFGFLGIDDGWLELVSGGHPGPVIVHADGSWRVVEFSSSLLGMLDHPRIEHRRLALRPGDEVVLVTDGVTDARDARGAWFGVDGVASAVKDARAAGLDTAEAVSRAVLSHAGERLRDDFAVLAVRLGAP